MIGRRHPGSLSAVVLLLGIVANGTVPAADGATPSTAATGTNLPNTVPAVPSDATPAAVRQASVFRPAPMPGDVQADWSGSGDPSSDGATLHPEILSMHQAGGSGGALVTASSDFDHEDRMRPAGGMGMTIPVQ